MTKANKKWIERVLFESLMEPVSSYYVKYIIDSIKDDVVTDVEECADKDFNTDDISLAVGRVLCKRMNIEI